MINEFRHIKIFKVGDTVVSDIFKTSPGFPYVIKIVKVDEEFGVIEFMYKGQLSYVGSDSLRMATKFEKFFGPIYDFFIK